VWTELVGENIIIGQTRDYHTNTVSIPAVILPMLFTALNVAHAEWLEAQKLL
jgi:hypothetical protein